MRYAGLASLVATVSLAASCSGSSADSPTTAAADAGTDAAADADADADAAADADAGADAATSPVCPLGQFANGAGACMPAGIQGCASMFVEADGLCHPHTSKCPAGTIPKLDTGCVAVGVPSCAAAFVEADGFCHPSQAKCPDGTVAVPDEGCVSLDGPDGCGDAPWGAIPDAPSSVYVDAVAAPGGDGSTTKPFTTIAAAVAAAQAGGRVVLAAGNYNEPIVAKKALEIRGRCASKVTVSGVYVNGDPVIVYVSSKGVILSGFTITGAGHGIAVTGGAVSASWLRVNGASLTGVLALSSSQVTLDHVLVQATKPVNGKLGRGIELEGATLVMQSSAIVEAHDMGILAQKLGTSAKITSSLVEGTLPSSSPGFGIALGTGATLDLAGSAVVANHGAGVVVPAACTATVATSILAGNLPGTASTFGPGLTVNSGGQAKVASTVVSGNFDEGLSAYDEGSVLDVSGSLIVGTTHGAELPTATALHVTTGATATVTSSAIVATDGIGVHLSTLSSTLTMTGSVVEETHAQSNADGYGLALDVAHATFVGNAFFNSDNAGVSLSGGVSTFTGNLVEGTVGLDSPLYLGGGALVYDGAWASFKGDAFLGNRISGFEIDDAAGVLDGILVRSSLPSKYTGRFGVGASFRNSDVTMTGSAIEGGSGYGLAVYGQGIVRISGTRVADVAAGLVQVAGVDTPFGDGITAVNTFDVRLAKSRIERCARSGITFVNAGTDIDDVISRGNAFGLVLQGATKPQLGGMNLFVDNQQNVVTDGALAVPDAPSVPTGP